MAVGDINGTERGSGARFNDGKPELDLLPIRELARYYYATIRRPAPHMVRAIDALLMLGTWQETGERNALYKALDRLDSDAQLVIECAHVFTYGKKKYTAWNWTKGMKWSIPLACAVRHLRAIIEGEYDDPESTLPHRGHVACNVFMLLSFMDTYPEGDDRPRVFEELRRAA